MMTVIPADELEVRIRNTMWELVPTSDLVTIQAVFRAVHGGAVMEYSADFGEARRLPGTVCAVEHVQSVVIGYDEKSRRWLLGLYMNQPQDKPRWVELVHWPVGDNRMYGAAAQQAGRALADYIGSPLKIFGAKKVTAPLNDPDVRGIVTGPLTPHRRDEIDPRQVMELAEPISLPIQYPSMWLGRERSGVTLRLAKDATSSQKRHEAPSFNQCVINLEQGTIRLMPPTGLLGAFLGGQARVLKTADVRNVELRHTVRERSEMREESGGLATEVTYLLNIWGVYLTLSDESLLLAQTGHETNTNLLRSRAVGGNKLAVDSARGLEYLRLHQADQSLFERAQKWAESAALVIAGALHTRLVKTEVQETYSADVENTSQ
ncbi:MAG TPA: hypothetical protein PKD09_02175 [Aggregatilinea sp.]|jgi:hypothetical protein|uniref:hypothetical protein n=1 Tax=Aggregatilinea sp. TaxID=2806333 RepID=UPI002D189C46|nr:hypothetical protein [Aggregatilinea sp.]HML20425.1 hypothetical protein [Aggregatilinea sp.]